MKQPAPITTTGRVATSAALILGLVALVATLHFLPQPVQPQPARPVSGIACGITKTAAGGYTFARLHVNATGVVVNASGCPVPLEGWNSVGAFLGTGGAVGNEAASSSALLPGDIVRVAFNSRWYTQDVYVPNQALHYRDWIAVIVATLEKRGNYVLLDANTAFFEPPCGNDGKGIAITFCPSEDQGRKDYANPSSPYYQNPQQLEEYQPVAVSALSLLAHTFAADPAVLFDVWNEPGGYIFVVPGTQQNLKVDMDARIAAVRAADPLTPVVVFTSGLKTDLTYTEPDLIFDFHVYPQFSGTSPVTGEHCATGASDLAKVGAAMAELRKAGRALIVGEWGGCYVAAAYNGQVLALAQTYGASLVYFPYDDLVGGKGDTKTLNANGQFVKADYTTLFSGK